MERFVEYECAVMVDIGNWGTGGDRRSGGSLVDPAVLPCFVTTLLQFACASARASLRMPGSMAATSGESSIPGLRLAG